MNRLASCFARLAAQRHKALLAYLVAGDPHPDCTAPAMHALVRGGVDIIELGVPFSDPEAEGPVIQAAHERALAHRVTLHAVLALASDFRRDDATTPIVLMGYLNAVERMGYAQFAEAAAAAGIDALILVNLPPEEAHELRAALVAVDIALVFLLAPTTTATRARSIAAAGTGFLYYVALKGITGADNIDAADVRSHVLGLRAALVDCALPLVIGFGIKNATMARRVAPIADGVVIGSALVQLMASTPAAEQPARINSWAREIRAAVDAAAADAS